MKKNIQEAAMDYMHSHECNFYAEDNNVTLYIGPTEVDVESIWYSDKEDKIYLHVGCKEFEGDLDIESLSEKNKERMLEAFGIDVKRNKLWDEVTQYVELANRHLEQEGVKAQIHIEKYGMVPNYRVYVLWHGEDVDVKDDDVRLEGSVEVVEKVWYDLVDSCCEKAYDYGEAVKLRRVSGDTHQGESNLICSFTDYPLFFIHDSGYIEDVGDNIDRFEDEDGEFAVNATDYHEAMRQVFLHENGIEN